MALKHDYVDLLAEADSAFDALKGEINKYKTEVATWSDGVRQSLDSECEHQIKSVNARQEKLEQRARELSELQTQVERAQAELLALRQSLDERAAECDTQERTLAESQSRLVEEKQAAAQQIEQARAQDRKSVV